MSSHMQAECLHKLRDNSAWSFRLVLMTTVTRATPTGMHSRIVTLNYSHYIVSHMHTCILDNKKQLSFHFRVARRLDHSACRIKVSFSSVYI